jgi:hypothetical protein
MLLPPLTVEQVLAWADAHHRRTGHWPRQKDLFHEVPGLTWSSIDGNLAQGFRGLPSGLSLRNLLAKHRGAPKKIILPLLTVDRVLAWADEHHRRTGQWPNVRSLIHGVPGGTWVAVNAALQGGCRGLPGGTTLRQLLIKHRRIKPDRQSGRGSGR